MQHRGDAAASAGDIFAKYIRAKAEALDDQRPAPTSRRVELGKAHVKRVGTDATLIAWSDMVTRSLAAAEALSREGIDVEVIDPRTLVPLDLETIIQSVMKTEHVVIAQEAVRRGGVASDIAATIQSEAFDYLDAPIEIVAGRNTAIPYNQQLEQACIPGVDDIAAAVRRAYPEGGRV